MMNRVTHIKQRVCQLLLAAGVLGLVACGGGSIAPEASPSATEADTEQSLVEQACDAELEWLDAFAASSGEMQLLGVDAPDASDPDAACVVKFLEDGHWQHNVGMICPDICTAAGQMTDSTGQFI